MLTRATFKNFRALRDVEVEFGRLTVLVGPNGSGKSSVLDGVSIVCRTGEQTLGSLFGAEESFSRDRTLGEVGPIKLTCAGTSGGITWSSSIAVRGNMPLGKEPTLAHAIAAALFSRGDAQESSIVNAVNFRLEWKLGIEHEISAARILRFESKQLAKPSYFTTKAPGIRRSGSGLSAALADLKLRDEEAFHRAVDEFVRVVPFVHGLEIEHADITETIHESVRVDDQVVSVPRSFTRSGYAIKFLTAAGAIDADAVGEGTLLVLGIVTAITARPRSRILLIEDLDRALHPKAQGELIDTIRKLLGVRPDLQIIATTHSPFILDKLQYDEVRAVVLGDDGYTKVAPLRTHPNFDQWKDAMLPGEFWTMVGERWLLSGDSKPTP